MFSILKTVMPLFVGAITVVDRCGGRLARERCGGRRWRERKPKSVMRKDAEKPCSESRYIVEFWPASAKSNKTDLSENCSEQ